MVGDERPRRRTAELVVEHRRLDLDEAAFDERASDRGDGREADLEHPPGVVVDDEVDVALAVAGVDVAEPVPLVRQGSQRLREQLEAADLHRQLALARGHHRAVDADPVAEVEPVELGVRGLAELGVRHEQLHAARLVAHGRERQLALTADEQDPPRDPHRGVGLDAGLELPELGAELAERPVTSEVHRIRIDTSLAQRVEVGEATGPLGGRVDRRHPRARSGRPQQHRRAPGQRRGGGTML